MKRDMDLCREILRRVEAHPGPDWVNLDDLIATWGEQEVSFQVYMLADGGLLVAGEAYPTNDGIHWQAHRLTWKGQDFLDASRDDTVWNRAKGRFGKAAGALTFDLLMAACKAEISELTGLKL